MRLVVVGAGATGGFLGARLARAGQDVTLVARGKNLAAMQAQGVRVIEAEDEDEYVTHPACTDDMGVVGGADVVFLTVKGHAVAGIAQQIGPLLGPATAVVMAQNGIPYWYFQGGYAGPLQGATLRSVDPDGAIAASIAIRRVIGCVVYPATNLVAPGVVQHVEGTRFTLGEPDGTKSDRCAAIAAALRSARLKAPISTRIRDELWLKLLGNVVMNPLSALTRATLADIATSAATRGLALAMMAEAGAVAEALGVALPVSIEQRLAGAADVGAHKSSMLQDLEAGRPLEIEPLLGAVIEIGRRLGRELPHLETVYACATLLDRTIRG